MTQEQLLLIKKFFPWISEQQEEQFRLLPSLYREWNSRINVISRKDIDNVFVHHILHSLSIALFSKFIPSTRIIDVGTGGGLPGIPLAILYPEVHFTLIDSIAKKIIVTTEIINQLELKNANAYRGRAEEYKGAQAHFVVSRAAMPMDHLMKIASRVINRKDCFNSLPNGVIALKGGDLKEELKPFKKITVEENISNYIPDIDFFSTKKIIYIPV